MKLRTIIITIIGIIYTYSHIGNNLIAIPKF